MHVLLVSHGLGSGGTDRVAVHLANGFAGVARTTLLHAARPKPGTGLVAMLDPAVERISLDRAGTSRACDMALALPALYREVRRLQPDLIVATGNNNSLFAYAAHRANPNPGKRLAIKITNPIVGRRHKAFTGALRKWLYARTLAAASAVLALSDAEARQVEAVFPWLADKVRVAQNPYVTDAMLAMPAGAKDPQAGREFLAIGRLHHQKNLPLMLRAWHEAALPNARLRIAGDGPLAGELAALAGELGIAGSVEFLGYRNDIARLLAEADGVLLSSDYEGLPAAVLEAFAAGRPVIATDSFPAARELVGDAPGCHLVACRDIAGFAGALRRFSPLSPIASEALRNRAEPYRIATAVRSHIAALGIA